MGRLVKLVGGGIGLAHEAIAARRVKSHNPVIVDADEGEFGSGVFNPAASSAFLEKHKAAVAHEEHSDPCDGDSADYDSADYDERLRVLDEAQGEHVLSSGFQHNSKTKNHAQTMDVDTFAAENPPPSYPYSRSSTNGGVPRLINPVIIPQRRPHDKTRGFIRAYAPVLQDFGIAPATFLAFLKEFHKRSQSSHWITAVNVAAFGIGFVPIGEVIAVSIAINLAAGFAMEIQQRQRTNNFLAEMNDKFFRPRGLYCMIMMYKPESSATLESVNVADTVVSGVETPTNVVRKQLRQMRLASGTTHGDLEMPESAPLVFPGLDAIGSAVGGAARGTDDSQFSKFKQKRKWVSDYYDRRSRAEFTIESQAASLNAVPEPTFASRYSDPLHPASNGSLISLITGGKVNPKGPRERRRAAQRGREYVQGDSRNRRQGLIRRILHQDALYLMIVEMPTHQETEEAKAMLQAQRVQGKGRARRAREEEEDGYSY